MSQSKSKSTPKPHAKPKPQARSKAQARPNSKPPAKAKPPAPAKPTAKPRSVGRVSNPPRVRLVSNRSKPARPAQPREEPFLPSEVFGRALRRAIDLQNDVFWGPGGRYHAGNIISAITGRVEELRTNIARNLPGHLLLRDFAAIAATCYRIAFDTGILEGQNLPPAPAESTAAQLPADQPTFTLRIPAPLPPALQRVEALAAELRTAAIQPAALLVDAAMRMERATSSADVLDAAVNMAAVCVLVVDSAEHSTPDQPAPRPSEQGGTGVPPDPQPPASNADTTAIASDPPDPDLPIEVSIYDAPPADAATTISESSVADTEDA